MTLHDYFETTRGTGVLATTSQTGQVDTAIYARPHVLDEETIAFIMADRLSHRNLQSNPQAAFLYVEDGQGYRGKRLHLTKVSDAADAQRIDVLRRASLPPECQIDSEAKYVVEFHVDRIRPLVGEAPEP